jgi:hypothetical protein
MIRRFLPFAALTLAGFCWAGLTGRGQDAPAAQEGITPVAPEPPVISTSASPDFPQVTCTSSDALACADALQLAADTHDQLATLLKLGPGWRFPVHIRIMAPDDPLLAKVDHAASGVFAQGDTMKLEVVVPSTDPDLKEFLQRQFVTALLWEKFFAKTTTFDKSTRIDIVPFWLVEGLRGWLNPDADHSRESIVRRAVHNQTVPTLEEVTNWRELSDDRLLGLWQKAFSFYLVDSITEPGPRRADFQQWLDGFAAPDASPLAQFHFPQETAWQRELADSATRSHDVVYTWDETLAQLTAAETVTFAPSKDAKVETCSIFEVPSKPHTTMMFEAIQERIYLLTELELRAHPSWNPVIEMERSALTLLVKDNQVDNAQKLLTAAQKRIADETAEHQRLADYVNWFEVTKNFEGNTSHFATYFATAKEMERVEADPEHPNPIRANLLQIESEL